MQLNNFLYDESILGALLEKAQRYDVKTQESSFNTTTNMEMF